MSKRQRKKGSDKAKAKHYVTPTSGLEGYELGADIYFPFKLTSTCPECKTVVVMDLTEEYISDPSMGEENEVDFSHAVDSEDGEYTEHCWSICVIPRFTLEVVGYW